MIRVLVVDDSAFARKVLREVLEAEDDMEVVGIARDGLEALEKIRELTPDVVTLDLVMPHLDGLGVLRALAPSSPPRIVVVSMSDADSDRGVEALLAGAVDLVHKPTALASERLYELGAELVSKVRIAAGANVSPVVASSPRRTKLQSPLPLVPRLSAVEAVVIGTSTGGPQAITQILRALPASFSVPIAIVVHMPEGYTAPLAARLDEQCALHVLEADEGTKLVAGTVVIARAGRHLELRRVGGDVFAALATEPKESLHRPAVDVLFTSAAAAYGAGTLAVVLTGMGNDGLEGARAVRRAGGRILAQDEASSVVYGMPRRVQEAGLADGSVALDDVASELQRHVG